ncbi:DUF1801 domain-containing protein [Rhodococcus sp. BP-252]|uniref:YdhG-like domain-containing protein n=1 Tax=Rhodococcoides kyotonense TaxID=398843 RepID=A0A177YLR0_9NOCA|nr:MULTISPECIES: DUF1801 domain-containing protein [Rhodococcus]MBY6414248.1 DUF1801 domain-containing protein [Rhodococcus sp. BP-320]MBY6419018.1 DUF1801 domain-containing protein [Rhodococcus sp. BP-321]MBY6423127.1 DUF1801 domain-containing protein [Rhodococcus sp. BP-324]MBY6429052.1 DUF1801 domain-containing protein [Rhodococcus sp. BP-323]MBY6434058.1 DUF1801 domain-containing protein [Rhodococcus sp. BP-322]
MGENKTAATDVDALAWLQAVEHPVRRADGLALHDMMSRVTGEPAVMWGPSMVGYGEYHYTYASGREGDSLAVGFSPRKTSLALYGLTYAPRAKAMLEQLGKHKAGAGCLYVNKLADVDTAVLEKMIEVSYPYVIGTLGT